MEEYYSYKIMTHIYRTERPTRVKTINLTGCIDSLYRILQTLARISVNKMAVILQMSNNNILKRIYDKQIAPRESDLPTSMLEGLQRVCFRHNYATMSYEKTAW